MFVNGMLVFLGGGIGSLLRYSVNFITQIYTYSQFGTLFVNALGSFLFGFFFIFARDKTDYFNLFFLVGILGGFTTFSQFSYDVISLQSESTINSAIYFISSTLISILLALIGIVLAYRILK